MFFNDIIAWRVYQILLKNHKSWVTLIYGTFLLFGNFSLSLTHSLSTLTLPLSKTYLREIYGNSLNIFVREPLMKEDTLRKKQRKRENRAEKTFSNSASKHKKY
jgi:hypothetical protein